MHVNWLVNVKVSVNTHTRDAKYMRNTNLEKTTKQNPKNYKNIIHIRNCYLTI